MEALDLEEIAYNLGQADNLLNCLFDSLEGLGSCINGYNKNKHSGDAPLAYETNRDYQKWVTLVLTTSEKINNQIKVLEDGVNNDLRASGTSH